MIDRRRYTVDSAKDALEEALRIADSIRKDMNSLFEESEKLTERLWHISEEIKELMDASRAPLAIILRNQFRLINREEITEKEIKPRRRSQRRKACRPPRGDE
jgi:hypothetical protein